MLRFVRRLTSLTSPGVWVILAIAIASSVAVAVWPVAPSNATKFWIFAKQHEAIYSEILARWNRANQTEPVELQILSIPVMEQRMMSGFLSATPVADILEVERSIAGRAFTGPIEQVGFVDLTERIKAEGLLEQVNAPSFSPWTSRGHVFGLPHDVHPVMLLYRSDIVEAAGIDVTQIETWDDFFRVMRPLMRDVDGDGRNDRYLLNLSPATQSATEVLLLQAGGGMFDLEERLSVNSPINAEVLANLVTWYAGPNRVSSYADVALSASGQQVFVDGGVVFVLAPDWVSGRLKQNVPALAGKVKVMPLPAWSKGGRRTSVWGGTMLGIAKTSRGQSTNWKFAKYVYFSEEVAAALFRTTGIVTPIKAHWTNPIFDEPDPYFSGQAVGREYLNLAPSVPLRASSPFTVQALIEANNCLVQLVNYAERTGQFDAAALIPEAQRLLDGAQRAVQAKLARNVFLSPTP